MKCQINVLVVNRENGSRFCACIPFFDPWREDDVHEGALATYGSPAIFLRLLEEARLDEAKTAELSAATEKAQGTPNVTVPVVGVVLTPEQLDKLGFSILASRMRQQR